MLNTVNKLTKLENVKIRDHIENYFNELNRKNRDYEDATNNTSKTYESEIRQFFHLIRNKEKGKELEYLTLDDINITQEIFESYVEILFNMKNDNGKNKYVNKSINKKITAMKSFVRYMKLKRVIDIDISYLELIKGEKERKVHYGALTSDEVLELISLAKQEKEKGEIKSKLISLCFKTGLRKAELLNLKWDSFIVKPNEIYVTGIGKGNKPFNIKIPKELYDELQTLNKGQSHIFDISAKGVDRMMDRLKKIMNIDENRRIVFHSIRKAYGTLIWKTYDIETARRMLRHENIATTQIYLGANEENVNDVVFSVDKIPSDLFRNVSHEQLIAAVSELSKSNQLILNMKLYELLNKTNTN